MTLRDKAISILVADDDADDRLLLREAFEENRIEGVVSFVEDGEQLLAYLRREGEYGRLEGRPYPGLVLLDLNMPKKDGRQALAEIKSDPQLFKIPVVVLSTSKAEDDIESAYGLGVSSFITKPVSFADLVALTRILTSYWLETVEPPPQCVSRVH